MQAKWKRGLNTHKKIGDQLRTFREALNVTQTTVAKFIGCSPSAISTLELGKFGSLELVERYAWALGRDLSDLAMADVVPNYRDVTAPPRRYKNDIAEPRRREAHA